MHHIDLPNELDLSHIRHELDQLAGARLFAELTDHESARYDMLTALEATLLTWTRGDLHPVS